MPTETQNNYPGNGSSELMISVVVPVRNEERHIAAVLDQLLAQDYPANRYEVLVADGMSTDCTPEIVYSYLPLDGPRVVLLPNPNQLSSAGRNVGVLHSRGDVVVFIDGHCQIPGRSLLSETARAFERTEADCLCRPQPLTAAGGNLVQETIAQARATALGHGRDSIIYDLHYEGPANPTSSGASYRRSVFERIGFYDESFDACEDVEFNHRVLRAGLNSYSSPRLAVFYDARSSFSGLFKQLFRYGRGRCRLIEKHLDAASLAQLIPSAMVAGFILGPLLALELPLARVLFLGALVLYAALLLGFSIDLAMRRGWQHLVIGPPVYVTIHCALGVGWWAEAFATVFRRLGVKAVLGLASQGGGAASWGGGERAWEVSQ